MSCGVIILQVRSFDQSVFSCLKNGSSHAMKVHFLKLELKKVLIQIRKQPAPDSLGSKKMLSVVHLVQSSFNLWLSSSPLKNKKRRTSTVDKVKLLFFGSIYPKSCHKSHSKLCSSLKHICNHEIIRG